jgi:hypothetical protein
MTESDNEGLQLVIATQSANYIIAGTQTPKELPLLARETFGESIAPLEIDFLNACQMKDVHIADQDCERHIGNIAEYLAPKFISQSKKIDELRAVFSRACDIVNEVIREEQTSIQEGKDDTERKLEILRSTKPLDYEPHLDWAEYAGLDNQLHATLDEIKQIWKARAARLLCNLCNENLTAKIKEATQKLQTPIGSNWLAEVAYNA